MITLEDGVLQFRFPEVHEQARCSIKFQRTLRIPDDGKNYPLPPGLGRFPMRHLDDHAARLPEAWHRRGGVMLPMHQAEAMWIDFGSERSLHAGAVNYPFAIKVATGKVCALTGDTWMNHLNRDLQDYVVAPRQRWLDGYCVGKGVIRQFVAMPLHEGYTAEEQLTGAATYGGLQIVAYPMKRERYEQLAREYEQLVRRCKQRAGEVSEVTKAVLLRSLEKEKVFYSKSPNFGLSPGGRMRQSIRDDHHGLDAWDQRHASRCFVTIVNSAQWMAVTRERPPTNPPSAKTYTEMGLPWFDYYDGDAEAVAGAEKLKTLASVAQVAENKGATPLPDNDSVDITNIVRLGNQKARPVRECE